MSPGAGTRYPVSPDGPSVATTSVSLLDRVCQGTDNAAWQRLNELYAPLIRNWLGRQNVSGADADDVAQDVLVVVLRKLPSFEHNGRAGAFRNWLRTITVNCLRDFWKTQRLRPAAAGDSSFEDAIALLADENSDLTQRWNDEHDRLIAQRLLEQIRPSFEDVTWQAFQRVAIDEIAAVDAAEELGISVASVYAAKSRVLARLRQDGAGLID